MMARARKRRGWFGSSYRHSLSARGIPNAPAKRLMSRCTTETIRPETVSKGIVRYPSLYHGTVSRGLRELDPAKSGRLSFGAPPVVSATDNKLLAETFTKGELGLEPRGEILRVLGPFTIVDINTPQGNEIWEKHEGSPKKMLEAGYDGIQFGNLEELKVEAFYKDIRWEEIAGAKEVQLFKKVDAVREC